MTIDKFSGANEFLSNFYPHRIRYDGKWYASTEHAYQAAKTTDAEKRKPFQIRKGQKTVPANKAKKLGRRLKLRPDWESVKVKVMEDCLRAKFADPQLKQKLLDTGTQELIEGNWWGDRFWGVCKGTGQNMLGKLLMELRDELSES